MRRAFVFAIGFWTCAGCSLMQNSMSQSKRVSDGSRPQRSQIQNKSVVLEASSRVIHNLEKKLQSKKEKEQYSKVLPWFSNSEEKLEFLNLPDFEARSRWMLEKDIISRMSQPPPDMKEAIDSQDITLGMPMDWVLQSWGDPTQREVSGNPVYKNEKWKYVRTVSGAEGFRQEKRIVYFENGLVVGWETQ